MSTTTKKTKTEHTITPVAMLSYPSLVKATGFTNDDGTVSDPKHSATFVFEPGANLNPLKQKALAVAKEKFGDKAAAMIKEGSLYWPFRTDVTAKGYPEGSTFFSARSLRRPGLVGRYPGDNGRPSPMEPEKFYPGAKVRGLVHFYAFDRRVKRGVAVSLDGVQFWEDGDRLDGYVDASELFEADLTANPDDALNDIEGMI